MPAVSAIGPVHDAVLARVSELFAATKFEVSQSAPAVRATVTVYDGVGEQKPRMPYVIVGGSSTEAPFNTLGPVDGKKWGADVDIPLRVVTQYPTTERQTYRIYETLKAGLDGQPMTVSGFASVAVELGAAQLLADVINGVVTRELVTTATVFVHQS